MRPRGEIREALGSAMRELGGGTWRDLATHAQVGYDVAKQTVRDMARAGEIQPAGEVRVSHSCRPMVRYEPASASAPAGPCALSAVVHSWADFD